MAENAVVDYYLPAPLGHWVQSYGQDHARLRTGSTRDFPLVCSAGMKAGAQEIESQSGPLCDGFCDKGFFCGEASIVPTVCKNASSRIHLFM